MFFLTVAWVLARSGGNAWTLYRMDLWGDGYCGANATSWTFSNDNVGPNATGVGINNGGCTGGIPEGFMMTRCLGEKLVCHTVGSQRL